MTCNIKYNNKNVNIIIDENKNLWFNNNIFEITFNDIKIKIILDNDSVFWFNIEDINKIITFDIKEVNKKYITKHLEFSDKIKFINKKGLYKIILNSNYIYKKNFINLLEESLPILLENKSFLYSNENLIKTTKLINDNNLYKYIK